MIMDTLKDWLTKLPNTFDVTALKVTIDDKTFQAASYKQNVGMPDRPDGWCICGHSRKEHHQTGKCIADTSFVGESVFASDICDCPSFRPVCPDTYAREAIYVLGEIPKQYLSRTCFTLRGDNREWYVACHIINVEDQFAEHHPFGANFILMPWDSSKFPEGSRDQKIDYFESKPYTRILVKIEEQR